MDLCDCPFTAESWKRGAGIHRRCATHAVTARCHGRNRQDRQSRPESLTLTRLTSELSLRAAIQAAGADERLEPRSEMIRVSIGSPRTQPELRLAGSGWPLHGLWAALVRNKMSPGSIQWWIRDLLVVIHCKVISTTSMH